MLPVFIASVIPHLPSVYKILTLITGRWLCKKFDSISRKGWEIELNRLLALSASPSLCLGIWLHMHRYTWKLFSLRLSYIRVGKLEANIFYIYNSDWISIWYLITAMDRPVILETRRKSSVKTTACTVTKPLDRFWIVLNLQWVWKFGHGF
jgi:hypothetical protein